MIRKEMALMGRDISTWRTMAYKEKLARLWDFQSFPRFAPCRKQVREEMGKRRDEKREDKLPGQAHGPE